MLQAFFYSPFPLLSREITPELRVLEKQHLECYLKSKHVFQVGKNPRVHRLLCFTGCGTEVLDMVVLQIRPLLYRSLPFPPPSSAK